VKLALRMLPALTFGLLIAGTSDAPAIERARHTLPRVALEKGHDAAAAVTQGAVQDHASGADIWMMIGVGAGLVGLQLRRKQKSLQHPLTLS
jgi:hypothetical protein